MFAVYMLHDKHKKKMILVKGRIPKKHYFQTVLIDRV